MTERDNSGRTEADVAAKLEALQQHWHAFGQDDPLWAILTTPGKRGGGWDVDEFLATGEDEVEFVLRAVAERGIDLKRRRALDFGCGAGRLTQALATRFDRCDGVDLADSMIAEAQKLNRHQQVDFHHNPAAGLELFDTGSFDLVLSLLVLQHMEPVLIRGYLREFVRVLRPGGVAYFNLPERVVLGEPLSAQAWRATLRLNGELPPFSAGRFAAIEVFVRNDSSVTWPASARLHVGNHWRSPNDELLVLNDARALVDGDVSPGEERIVRMEVVAPGAPGEYVLEIDLVQEHVNWFADRGSTTLRLPVLATAPASDPTGADSGPADADESSAFVPRMEMYPLSRSDVAAAVEAAGGVVLSAFPADRCGPSFPSLDYIVTRPHRRLSGRFLTWARARPGLPTG